MSTRATTSNRQSAELFARASRVVPGGVNTCRRKIDPPLCVRRAYGAYFEDLDGQRYIDYHAAYGPILLGHCYPRVNEAVSAAIEKAVLVGVGTTELEVRLAEKIVEHVPSCEQVLLCNSGSEATFHAIRLARAVTGRQKVIKFQGCYDGFHDYVLRNVLSSPDLIGKRDPGSSGMLDEAVDRTLICRFNDSADVERVLSEHEGEVAAVIVEPVAHNAPSILPENHFLTSLRDVTERHDALLIFDEVITGFRHHLGGYQAISGVLPDLTTLGKAIGNGFPIAAVGGRRELMQRFNTVPNGDVHYGGTYCGSLPGAAAAIATIAELEERPVHEHLYRLGQRMRDGFERLTREAGVAATVTGLGSIYVLSFMEPPLRSYEDAVRNDASRQLQYRRELIRRGVFEMPESSGRNHISFSHTDNDIDRSLEAAQEALRVVGRIAS